MDFDLQDDEKLLQQTARDFARRDIAPKAAEIDRSGRWPAEIVKQLGKLGFLGVTIPEAYGGAGMSSVAYTLALEEIGAACASSAGIMSVHNSLFCDPLSVFGCEQQKKEVLTPCARGEMLGCFALAEATGGADARAAATVGETQADGSWVLDGAESGVASAPHADFILVLAVTDPRTHGEGQHTAFLVPTGTRGLTKGPPDSKLGMHGAHSCTLVFESCPVPASAVVGHVGKGLEVARAALDAVRLGVAAQAVGIARAALETTIPYAKQRKSFGVPIAEHQAIQFMLADMGTELDAARLLVWKAASLKDAGVAHAVESAQAKHFASEMAARVTSKAIQVHGGYGYSAQLPLERHYRDARITEVDGGTGESQRLVITASDLPG